MEASHVRREASTYSSGSTDGSDAFSYGRELGGQGLGSGGIDAHFCLWGLVGHDLIFIVLLPGCLGWQDDDVMDFSDAYES